MPSADIQFLNADSKNDKRYHHEDTIHDIQFNWYGDMMATCSSDHKVKIWDKQENGTWGVIKEIMAHYSPVWRISWAHPDYGHILATCSMDHRATIWRMVNDDKTNWVKKELTDSASPVTDVKFAPRTWSDMMTGSPDELRLAACSEEKVRLYTVELNSELNDTYCYCTPENIIDNSGEAGISISCLSWNSSSRFANLVLAVGIAGKAGSRVDLYNFNDNQVSERSSKRWSKVGGIPLTSKLHHIAFRPNNGARDSILAVATESELAVFKLPYTEDMSEEVQLVPEREPVGRPVEDQSHPIKHISWDMFGRQIITLFASGVVKSYSWKFQPKRQWAAKELVSNMDLTNISYH